MQLFRRKIARAFAVTALAVSLSAPGASAAQEGRAGADYTPQIGQEGKDVIWVPTPPALVERMLEMADVKPSDYVVDLGSGDGRTVIAAAKRGAQALGIEYNPDMVELSRRNAETEGVSSRARFMKADIFETDFSQATVVTMYLLPTLNVRLRPTLLRMKPGTRIVSHAFLMGDWPPDRTESADRREAYLWIVPAAVEGTWQGSGGARHLELALRQHFQSAEGVAKIDGTATPLRGARLAGDRFTFALGEAGDAANAAREFTGRVNGNVIEGTLKSGDGANRESWVLRRVGN